MWLVLFLTVSEVIANESFLEQSVNGRFSASASLTRISCSESVDFLELLVGGCLLRKLAISMLA